MKKLIFFIAFLPFVSNAQIISTIAGSGVSGYAGDGGSATAAKFNRPTSLAIDASGNMYIADYANNVIRKVNTSGIISTIAGNGSAGYSGDGGAATMAKLNGPSKVITDASGNLYFADFANNVIRKVNSSGVISTIAGNSTAGYSGDGGAATLAMLNGPTGIFMDGSGNLIIADYNNNRIRKINTSGIISTFAGIGTAGYSGDGAAATLAKLNLPEDICADASGNVFISDANNSCIRKVNTTGQISTIAGTGTGGYTGDGVAATTSELFNPYGIVIDGLSNIYIADQNNNRIRKINSSGIISTIAGTGVAGYSGDGGAATLAQLNIPSGVALDASGNIYIADQHNYRVRNLVTCVNISIQPKNDTVANGDTAKFWVGPYMVSASYQWQENDGSGWVDLTNVLPYSGVNTDTLTIHNVIHLFNNSNYRCIITSYGLCVDSSSSAVLIVGPGLGINQMTTTEAISIYPNPADNDIILSVPQQIKSGNIQLINQVGQLMIERNINNGLNNIDISTIPAGMYIVKIQLENQFIYKKIIKN